MATTKVTKAVLSAPVANNLIINGDMRISQRGASFAGLTNQSAFTLDRWEYQASGAAVVTITQDSDTPNNKFISSLKIDCTTVESAVAAGEYAFIGHYVEGLDAQSLALGTSDATSIAISFWVKSTKTGTYCVTLRNSAANRSYPAEYTVDVSDTWEKKTVTLTGDTTGTWLTTNGIGLRLDFVLLVGSTYHGTAGSWEGANDIGTSSQVNALDNTANNFFLTGVQLEVGTAASDFEHRDYASELVRCQRYMHRISDAGSNMLISNCENFSTTRANGCIPHRPVMRSSPTLTVSGATDFFVQSAGANDDTTALALGVSSANTSSINITVSSGLVAGEASRLITDGGGTRWIQFDAEL